MYGLRVLRPVDPRDVAFPRTFVGHVIFILDMARRLPGLNQLDRFRHRLYSQREEVLAVDVIDRCVRSDGAGTLQQNRSGIQPLVKPRRS